jgi:hypothetical protein
MLEVVKTIRGAGALATSTDDGCGSHAPRTSLVTLISGGGPRTEGFYGETVIPRGWVERRLCAEFELIGSTYDLARYDQECFVLRRR